VRYVRLDLALASLAIRCCIVRAWSQMGHERIARVAEHLLVGKSKDQVRSMMHIDLPDMVNWEETMTKKYPETGLLHWHRQDPEWKCDQRGGLGDKQGHIACDEHGASKGSLFCAMAYFFEHFAHDALLKEFPEPKAPINTPTSLVALEKIPANEQTPANYLKWLVILVGDLHQPLHWLHDHSHGKDVMIRYKDAEYTLLQFWEDYLPNHLHVSMDSFISEKDFGVHAKVWAHKLPTELFREWAKEVAEKLCSEVYAPMTVNHADGTRVESPFTLTDDLFEKWVKIAEDLLQLSGERLAFVLNEIIEHKRHKDAHKDGRGLPTKKVAVDVEKKAVVTKEEKNKAKEVKKNTASAKEGRKNPVFSDNDISKWIKELKIEEKRRSRSNALYNGCIAAVLVPLLLYAYHWHEKIGGGSLWKIAKEKM